MAVWQIAYKYELVWRECSAAVAAKAYRPLYLIRLVTDPATLRDCWHCGRVMEAGPLDEKGRDWCGCMQARMKQMIADAWRRKENERSLT